MTIYSGFSHWKWWFSIVMLVYQRVTVITLHQKASKGYSEISPFWWNLHRSFGGSCRQPLHVGGQHIPRTTQRAISPYLKVHLVAILRYPPNKNTTELGIGPKWCPLDVSCFILLYVHPNSSCFITYPTIYLTNCGTNLWQNMKLRFASQLFSRHHRDITVTSGSQGSKNHGHHQKTADVAPQ